MIVTRHAIDRYRERVEPVTPAEAEAVMRTQAVQAAIAFGAKAVRLGNGARLVLEGETIVTVLGPQQGPCISIGRSPPA